MPLILRPPSSRESLTASLGGLGRARRAVALAAALLTLAGLAAGAVVLTAFLDAWLGLPALARAFALVGGLAGAGVYWLRYVAGAWGLRADPLAVAMDLEARDPRLNDSLASAVSFLMQDEAGQPPAGSPRLRRAAVTRGRAMAERFAPHGLVPANRCWRAAGLCAAALLTGLALTAAHPDRAAQAAVRLADPFGPHPYPPRTAVTILLPDRLPARLAVGDAFELRFSAQGVIPERAEVHVRFDGGGGFADVVPVPQDPEALTDAGVTVAARIDGGRLSGSFAFRVAAGDGDTGWQAVAVAPPPKLVPRDGRASPQIRISFPAYTRLASVELADGGGVVEAPFGSRLTLRAAADVRLSAASIAFLGDRSSPDRAAPLAAVGLMDPLGAGRWARLLADDFGRDVPVTLGPDGRQLDAAFTPSLPGSYGLRMTDETGLTGTRLLELRLQADPPPLVVLRRPNAGDDPAVFAPDVALAVDAAAEDGLFGVRRLFLEYQFNHEGAYQELILHDGPAARAAGPAVGGGAFAAADPQPGSVQARLAVPVARLRRADGSPPRDGDVVTLRAAADDWDDVSAVKAPGRSAEIDIRIVSRPGIEAFLQRELAALRVELLRVQGHQRERGGRRPKPRRGRTGR